MSTAITAKQNVSKMCIVCGVENDLSLKMRFFERDDGALVGVFSGKQEHQSYPGRMHGGMISAILDETIGRVMMMGGKNEWAVTVELNVRFLRTVPLGTQLTCVAKATRDTKRIFEGEGEILLPDGTSAAKATAKYVKMSAAAIAEGDIEQYWIKDDQPIPDCLTANS